MLNTEFYCRNSQGCMAYRLQCLFPCWQQPTWDGRVH